MIAQFVRERVKRSKRASPKVSFLAMDQPEVLDRIHEPGANLSLWERLPEVPELKGRAWRGEEESSIVHRIAPVPDATRHRLELCFDMPNSCSS
jgi:hypothetical protein